MDLDSVVSSITGRLVDQLTPKMKEVVARASEAAEPTIRKVVVQDVLPKFGLAVVLGLVGGAVVAAAIGSHYATRRR